jgi:hypothetical protein
MHEILFVLKIIQRELIFAFPFIIYYVADSGICI